VDLTTGNVEPRYVFVIFSAIEDLQRIIAFLSYSDHYSIGRAELLRAPMISIVEDDAFARGAMEELIESLGYEVAGFGSGNHFLLSGCVEETWCLITDLHMPGLSGLDLQSHLLAEGYRFPIIFVTAFPDDSVRARALNAGAVGFLSKPFPEESLIACLKIALTVSGKTSANGPH
jgi:FixJ family two-component response regulator